MEAKDPKNKDLEDEEEVDEEEQEQVTLEQLNEMLLKACKENNYKEAEYLLSKQASPTDEKDGWNPLLWAASNGNEDLVKLLIKHNACAPYLN